MLGFDLLQKEVDHARATRLRTRGGQGRGSVSGATLLRRGWLSEPNCGGYGRAGPAFVRRPLRHPLDPKGRSDAADEVVRRMLVVPFAFGNGRIDGGSRRPQPKRPGKGLERMLGRGVELVVGERTAIQDAWRFTRDARRNHSAT